MTNPRSCLFATTLLRDRADAWFRIIELTDDAPTSWLELKRLIVEFFRPDNSTRITRDKLAVLKQTTDLVTYINQFTDIKLAIPGMTDEEGCDKFIRGLNNKLMRSNIRQYEASTLKEAIQAALAFDSAQQEEDYTFVSRSTSIKQRMDGPMDLDYAEERNFSRYNPGSRSKNDSSSYYRSQNNAGFSHGGNRDTYRDARYSRNTSSSSVSGSTSCYYCHKMGHMKRSCRTHLSDIKKLDDQHSKRDFQSM